MSIMNNFAAERLWLHTQAHLNEKADKKAVKEQLQNISQDVPQIVKNSFPGGVGYAEVTETYSDTLNWDGNTEGLESVSDAGYTLYHISDAVPTKEDCSNGVKISLVTPDGEIPIELTGEEFQVGFQDDGMWTGDTFLQIIPTDNYTYTKGGWSVTFPKAGMYFLCIDGGYTSEFTIPGYNGFKTVTKVVNHIDPKFLPEADITTIVKNSFPGGVGYEEVQTVNKPLNITWDGNTDGREYVDDGYAIYCKVSDATPTLEQLQNGGVVVDCYVPHNGDDPSNSRIELSGLENQSELLDAIVLLNKDGVGVVVIRTDGAIPGFQKGLYLTSSKAYDDADCYASALTTTESIGYVNVTTKKLDAKYLPDYLPNENPVEILPETTFTMNFNEGYFDLRGMFTGVYSKGDVCTVIFDSIEYECTAYIEDSEMSYTALGGFDQSYPFFVYSHYVRVQDEQQHTIRIINRNVKKLDNKFLDINTTDNIMDAEDDDIPTVKAVMDELNGFAGWVDSELSKIPALPEITSADNGKVLMVVNGKLQLVSLNLSVDANGVITVQ